MRSGARTSPDASLRSIVKRSLRNAAVLIMSSPAIAAVYALALIRGKEQAIRLVGPFVTSAAKASLRYWVPEIRVASQFDMFRKAIRSNIRRWKPLYDVDVTEDDPDTFKINVINCPFCEVFPLVGLKDLNEYVCRADWEIAADNKGKWTFGRTRTIGAGDSSCDHTYRRCAPPERTPDMIEAVPSVCGEEPRTQRDGSASASQNSVNGTS